MTEEAISRANGLIFSRLALFLNEQPDFINEEMIGELTSKFGLEVKEAFSLLLQAALGFDDDYPPDRELWANYSPFMINHLDENVFLNDEYYRAIKVDEPETLNEWELKSFYIAPFTAFVCGDPVTFPDGRIIPRIGFFDCGYRYPGITQNGREWMTLLPNESVTQRIPVQKARGKVLTYGLGLGYFAFMASLKPEVKSITVVERDENVIKLFETILLPKFPHREKINIVCADAFDYAANVAPNGSYDYVFADIWHDPTDGVEAYKRFKTLETDKRAQYDYWIEDTLKLYMED